MTAEVAIINKSAIAVAADSAVTVGRNKVHRSANKIFALCDNSSIGVMVYGHAEFAGIPWETLVKVFRREGGAKGYSTVGECYSAFREFLRDPRFFTKEAQENSLLHFSISIIEGIHRRAANIPNRELTKKLPGIIEKQINDLQAISGKLTFDAPELPVFRRSGASLVRAVAEQAFEERRYNVPPALRSAFTQLIYTALCCPAVSDYAAGVVLFGFGDAELLPSLVSHEVDGSCFGSIRSRHYGEHFTKQGDEVAIVPFADREDMEVFIEGIHNDIRRYFIALMGFTANKIAERVIKENYSPTEEQYKAIKAINDKAVESV